MSKSASAGGIGVGGVVAGILSWSVNHSILLCILHVFCTWVYVLYWFVTYSK